jgi:hypothetical protein
MPSQDPLITEQLDHLRRLTHFYAHKAMGGDKQELEKFLEAQARLMDLLPYRAGYQQLDMEPQEAPAPLLHSHSPPPLRPVYDVDEAEDSLEPTRVTFPPDPLFDQPMDEEDPRRDEGG